MNRRFPLPSLPTVVEGRVTEAERAPRALPELWRHVKRSPESGDEVAAPSPSCAVVELRKENRPIRAVCTGSQRPSITSCAREVARKWREFGVSVARETHHAGFDHCPFNHLPLLLPEFR